MQLRTTVSLVFAIFLCGAANADITGPPGMGTAGWWITPCQLFERMMTNPAALGAGELSEAALCQGLFTGIMAVNYVDPPYLPFCESDKDNTLEYVRTFLAFMRANPSYADKKLGLALLVALGKAHPKEQCMH
jgi:hypothetical protein